MKENKGNENRSNRAGRPDLISAQVNIITCIIDRMSVTDSIPELLILKNNGVAQLENLMAIKIKQEETAEEMESE